MATGPFSSWRHSGLIALIVVAAIAGLWLLGRTPMCTCGYVKLWHGEAMSSENSQHLLDWYSPSHVLHGLLLYLGLRYLLARQPLSTRFVIATLIEAAWELVENTDMVIQHYRDATISLDYYGDSILNSTADIVMMMIGFLIAWRAPVWLSIALFVAAELFVGYMIRDGLILNIIMLLWPLETIKSWQAAA